MSLFSSLMWGSADFLGGFYSRSVRPMAVYGISQVLALVVLVVVATLGGSWGDDTGYIPWAIASSVLGLVGMLTFYRALAMGPMGIVSPLAALSVVVPVAFGLLTGETPTGVQVLGILVAIIGILLASGPELSGAESAKPIVLSLVALVCFGGMYLTMARGSAFSPIMTTTSMRITSAAIVLVVALVARSAGGAKRRDLPGLALLGVLDAAANISYGWATTQGLLTTVAVLGSLYPVVTAVLAAIVLHERLRAVQYVGVAATVVAVILISAG